MLTARGWWFLSLAALVTLAGVAGLAWWSAAVPLLGLTLVAYGAAAWVLCAARFRAAAGRLRVDREVLQAGRAVPAVWAGGTATVRVTVTLGGPARLPFVVLTDRPPADLTPDPGGADPDAGLGPTAGAFDLRPGEPAVVEYGLRAAAPGVWRFEGVEVRVADVAGLFYRRLFVRAPVEVPVLPPLYDPGGRQRGTKRFNALPPPGAHRLRRPGGGTELLDLRDYQPGDPPKMIAWKASARRDRLITREIESEIPVRCVLFVDASTGARVGPPGRAPVVRLAGVAAGVAQAAVAGRDLVGLAVFDEHGVQTAAPARTQVHLIRMLRTLAEAAGRLPDPLSTDADLLARYADPVARGLYPDLFAGDLNSRPLGMYWRPISDSRWFVPFLVLLFSPLALLRPGVQEAVAKAAQAFAPTTWGWAPKLALLIGIVTLPVVLAGLVWFVHGVRGLLAPRGPRTARRKQLGAVYAAADGAGPAAVERHLRDDEFFARRTARFLLDHRVRVPLVLHDPAGRYRFRSEGKVGVLATALARAVARARDNELYVVLADLAELGADVGPLAKVVMAARARHHQVLVVVPWPADVPRPDDPGADGGRARKGVRLGALVRAVLVARYHRGYADVRATLTRAGATVVRADDGDPVRRVLDRLDRVRGVRARR